MFLLYCFRIFLFFSFVSVVSLLIFFGFSFSKGDSEKKLANEGSSTVVDEHSRFSEFVVENEAGKDVFVDFPEDFDEKNILPLSKDVKERSKSNSKSQLRKKTKLSKKSFRGKGKYGADKKYRAKSKKYGKGRVKLEKVSKLYYKRDYKNIIKLYFTRNELDMLFFKAMSYRALAFQSDADQKNSSKAKNLLNKIASKTKSKKLKEKALLWMGITEWQFPTVGKSFLSRIYPLRYLQRKIDRSRASNDADLYIAFFYEQNNDYEKAKHHYQKLMKSDPNDLVYDVNIKKFTHPHKAAELYLSAIKENLAQQKEKDSEDDQSLAKNVEVKEKEKKVDEEKAAIFSEKAKKKSDVVKKSLGEEKVNKAKAASFEKEKDFDEIRKKLEAFKSSSPAAAASGTVAKEVKEDSKNEQEQPEKESKESSKEEGTENVDQQTKENDENSSKDEQFVEINSEKKDSSVVNEKEVEEEFFFE